MLGAGGGSEGREEEEIHIHQHGASVPASKQGAGERHTQRALWHWLCVTFSFRRREVVAEQKLFVLKSYKPVFAYSSLNTPLRVRSCKLSAQLKPQTFTEMLIDVHKSTKHEEQTSKSIRQWWLNSQVKLNYFQSSCKNTFFYLCQPKHAFYCLFSSPWLTAQPACCPEVAAHT